nr:NACHT domain-containing protein [Leptolyngbya sp. FACHB-711]
MGKFEIGFGLGVRSQELPGLLAEHSPQVVHFCGHGAGEQGLVFQDENGREQFVSTAILARLFKTFADEINCVVLNACDSDRQAEAIVAHINYVVGISQPILDKAAYYFATGFYQGLATGKSIEQSYELGCIAVQIWVETNSSSAQKYRKLEYLGEVSQPAQPQIQEYLKPVLLRKRDRIATSPVGGATSPNRPQQFTEFVHAEVDRKEYKDQARAAYDSFGQFSTENVVDLKKSEYAQRKILVNKVKEFWIEGFLKPSLQGVDVIRLDLAARPEAIADLSQRIEALSVELDNSYEELRDTQIYQEMGQGRTLLILGDPGAGKTIALLQLAQRLIERSEQNLSLPMPIVFNLSSWARDRKSIVDWLIDELREKYQVPKSLSEPWITQQQLILLLDGLDEVNEEYRNDCVRALNQFIGLFPKTEIAVCSRVKDYEALTERLQISSALCLQPVSPKQVYQFLDSVGGALTGLKTLLKSDAELEQFAQTPLILNLMSAAYQGWSAERLVQELRSTADRTQHLFDTYIDRRLERGAASEYPKPRVLRWLSWLANQMVQEKRTIFLIEKMQPTWLQNRGEEKAYRMRVFIVFGLIFGLLYGVIVGLLVGLIVGLIYGLIFGLIFGLSVGLANRIEPLEQLSWSWQRAKAKFIREFFTGVGYGLLYGPIFGLIFGLIAVLLYRPIDGLLFGPIDGLLYGLDSGLSAGLIGGLIGGLIFGLGSGLGSSEIIHRTVPNQGIRTSLRNCLAFGLIGGLIGGLIFGLIGGLSVGLSVGWYSGLIGGLIFVLLFGLKYGGVACIQHFILRQMLYQKGRIPWNYAKFLDFASDRLLMKKIGGGYVFFHRMLLEHFARMNPN